MKRQVWRPLILRDDGEKARSQGKEELRNVSCPHEDWMGPFW